MIAFLVVRAYRIVRAIFRMEQYSTGEERFILVRSLYEIYCKLIYLSAGRSHAEQLFAVDFGLIEGTHEIQNSNGKLNKSKIVDKASGKIFDRYLKFSRMISFSRIPSDGPLFDYLYEFLSSFVHSGSRHIRSTWKPDMSGFELVREDESLTVFVSLLTHTVSGMIMQEMLRIRGVSLISVRDIRSFCTIIKKMNLEIVATAKSYDPSYERLFALLRRRSVALPRNNRSRI